MDIAETLARERAVKLFGCDHVNVQPHSGTQANMAVYFAALQPGDTILGMNLSHGGTFPTEARPIFPAAFTRSYPTAWTGKRSASTSMK